MKTFALLPGPPASASSHNALWDLGLSLTSHPPAFSIWNDAFLHVLMLHFNMFASDETDAAEDAHTLSPR